MSYQHCVTLYEVRMWHPRSDPCDCRVRVAYAHSDEAFVQRSCLSISPPDSQRTPVGVLSCAMYMEAAHLSTTLPPSQGVSISLTRGEPCTGEAEDPAKEHKLREDVLWPLRSQAPPRRPHVSILHRPHHPCLPVIVLLPSYTDANPDLQTHSEQQDAMDRLMRSRYLVICKLYCGSWRWDRRCQKLRGQPLLGQTLQCITVES